MKSELQEIQRYGRNKSTVVNQTYINGGQYRSKFDKISDDKLLNRKVYQIAKKMLKHTHPNSMPPSINDFNSALKNGYRLCVVCCHDGKIFLYHAKRHVPEFLYKAHITKYKRRGINDYDAQMIVLDELQRNGDIFFKEVE